MPFSDESTVLYIQNSNMQFGNSQAYGCRVKHIKYLYLNCSIENNKFIQVICTQSAHCIASTETNDRTITVMI